MADERVRLPASTGGLVRYYDEYKSKLSVKPIFVILFIILLVIIEIWLHKVFG